MRTAAEPREQTGAAPREQKSAGEGVAIPCCHDSRTLPPPHSHQRPPFRSHIIEPVRTRRGSTETGDGSVLEGPALRLEFRELVGNAVCEPVLAPLADDGSLAL